MLCPHNKGAWGVLVKLQWFLTSVANGELLTSCPVRFNIGCSAAGSRRIGGWLDLKAFLDKIEARKVFPSCRKSQYVFSVVQQLA
jgi:hypothetical protein